MKQFRVSIEISRYGRLVTPRELGLRPVHNWLYFPHSYDPHLVHELVRLFDLKSDQIVLDPFVGAGTTLLVLKEMGIRSTGYDLSPFSVFVTGVKTQNYSIVSLRKAWDILKVSITKHRKRRMAKEYPELVRKALSNETIIAVEQIKDRIALLDFSGKERDLFYREIKGKKLHIPLALIILHERYLEFSSLQK